ncbi:hypothetical protein GCK72_015468 [Caenorhabditis remanei]|uniref:Uncharacterized protein n=1 Tax=Caenorhabditis remanei TaxID=31234 RepID=A0A6A5GU55_CAERE|nr:hypothetical protein GCK72_015468 [Caenorhabditis remanei]KAF1759008.1 hypothetical protein GCK72_015468 [Caenorhabditis remanei]
MANLTLPKAEHLRKKRKECVPPTAAKAKLGSRFLYGDATLMLHMCYDCRRLSRNTIVETVGETHKRVGMLSDLVQRLCPHTGMFSKFYNFDIYNMNRTPARQGLEDGEPAPKKLALDPSSSL